jgi:hypothetical protein
MKAAEHQERVSVMFNAGRIETLERCGTVFFESDKMLLRGGIMRSKSKPP